MKIIRDFFLVGGLWALGLAPLPAYAGSADELHQYGGSYSFSGDRILFELRYRHNPLSPGGDNPLLWYMSFTEQLEKKLKQSPQPLAFCRAFNHPNLSTVNSMSYGLELSPEARQALQMAVIKHDTHGIWDCVECQRYDFKVYWSQAAGCHEIRLESAKGCQTVWDD